MGNVGYSKLISIQIKCHIYDINQANLNFIIFIAIIYEECGVITFYR